MCTVQVSVGVQIRFCTPKKEGNDYIRISGECLLEERRKWGQRGGIKCFFLKSPCINECERKWFVYCPKKRLWQNEEMGRRMTQNGKNGYPVPPLEANNVSS